jgi:hypothetical protein
VPTFISRAAWAGPRRELTGQRQCASKVVVGLSGCRSGALCLIAPLRSHFATSFDVDADADEGSRGDFLRERFVRGLVTKWAFTSRDPSRSQCIIINVAGKINEFWVFSEKF